MATIRIGNRTLPLPRSAIARRILGAVLVVFGLLGFLPVLGFWMIPLGLLVLSIDSAPVRRFRRRATVLLARRLARRFPSLARRIGLPV